MRIQEEVCVGAEVIGDRSVLGPKIYFCPGKDEGGRMEVEFKNVVNFLRKKTGLQRIKILSPVFSTYKSKSLNARR